MRVTLTEKQVGTIANFLEFAQDDGILHEVLCDFIERVQKGEFPVTAAEEAFLDWAEFSEEIPKDPEEDFDSMFLDIPNE